MKNCQFTYNATKYVVDYQNNSIVKGSLYTPYFKFEGEFKNQLPFKGVITFESEKCHISPLYHYLYKFQGVIEHIEHPFGIFGFGTMEYLHKNGKTCFADGNFTRSLLFGEGKMHYLEVEQQHGNYVNGVLCGHGQLLTENFQTIIGTFVQRQCNYQMHGRLNVKFANGCEHIVQAVDGLYHGLVKQTHNGLESLHVYEENKQKSSMQQGKIGQVLFPDEDCLMGNIIDGKREGKQIIHKPNGDVVKCLYKDNKLFKYLEYFKENGEIIYFVEQNSADIYQVQYEYNTGDVYRGSLNTNFQKHGEGSLTKLSGEVIDGVWQQDMLKDSSKIVTKAPYLVVEEDTVNFITNFLKNIEKNTVVSPKEPIIEEKQQTTQIVTCQQTKMFEEIAHKELEIKEKTKKVSRPEEFSIDKLREQLRLQALAKRQQKDQK